MSAIAGIFLLDGRPAEQPVLQCMVDKLAHRGPDGAGVWHEGSIGLGHRMLWTTPQSLHEELPLRDAGYALVANARIDNREELCDLLGLDRRDLAEVTDSYLILRAYQKWGEACPTRLLGDFTFAIWDEEKQQIFCTRDHFGIKPFYYYLSDRAFVFATELKAIFCWPEVPRRLNEVRVADFLHFEDCDRTTTLYQEILRLPPGHTLTVGRNGAKLCQYWQLDPEREIRLSSDQEYADALRELFIEAVRCRLRSAFPVGSLLSGGLDSSAITCVAHDLLCHENGRKLYTFSALHGKVPESDEREYIQAVLSRGSYHAYLQDVDEVSPLVDLERLLWHHDEAFAGGNSYILWTMYGAAEKHGVRVLLEGFDGDSTISHGLGLLIELASTGKWFRLAGEVIAYSRKTNTQWGPPLWAWVNRYGLQPAISKVPLLNQLHRRSRFVFRQARHRIRPTQERPFVKAHRPEFLRRLNLENRYKAGPVPRNDREKQYLRLMEPGMVLSLESRDKCASAFSIDLRYPFWDKRLIEFCLAVPAEQKMVRGWTRMMMRRAMTGILPPEVQWRGGKANMHPSFERNLYTYEKARLDQIMEQAPKLLDPYVDIPAFRNAYARYIAGKSSVEEVNTVWRCISLALWLQQTGLRP